MPEEKPIRLNPEDILRAGNLLTIQPQGTSMYPFLYPGRDYVTIEPIGDHLCKRGEVILYRRDESILVLHRVHHRHGNEIYMLGDGQTRPEGPLRPDQMRGRMIAYHRKGKDHTVHEFHYILLSRLWLLLRPARLTLLRTRRRLRKLFHLQSDGIY